MYILDFLSIHEIRCNEQYELSNQKFDMIMKRYPHLHKFFETNEEYKENLNDKKFPYKMIDFPIRDIEIVKGEKQLGLTSYFG